MPANNQQSVRKKVEIHQAFDKIPASQNGTATDYAHCRFCKNEKKPFKRTWNTTVMGEHLKHCERYQRFLVDQDQAERTGIAGPSIPRGPLQTKLAFSSQPGGGRQDTLNALFGMAMFTSCTAFSMFNTPEWEAFFNAIGFKVPERHAIANTILDQCYTKVKSDVLNVFDSSPFLSMVSDESTNIKGHRIENVSVICKGTSYNWSNESLEDKSASAENTVLDCKEKALEFTRGDLNRLSAFCSDTCPTMQKTWKQFAKLSELAHIFNVGCDSHGQQLVIGDIIDPGVIKGVKITSEIHDFWLDFQSIITQFGKKKTLQLGILRQKQLDSIGKEIALLPAVKTRWGTQVSFLIQVIFTSNIAF
jgi:hypothetical protein